MLVKCPACSNDISSDAAACPKCGHPMAQQPEAARKVSHSAGWISLAAFILANFTPAILAPLFVLVGLAFAAKELSGGGKIFGVVVLCLSLLQGWFVVDHFGHISGTLGITTAKDSDSKAAARYANASIDVPANWREVAQAKCQEEWPTDYSMQEHCMKNQTESSQTLAEGSPAGIDPAAFRVIRGKCAEEWPRDFQMRAHCEKQQYEGYRELNGSPVAGSTRNSCAQQWPSDYQMRRYCEKKGG